MRLKTGLLLNIIFLVSEWWLSSYSVLCAWSQKQYLSPNSSISNISHNIRQPCGDKWLLWYTFLRVIIKGAMKMSSAYFLPSISSKTNQNSTLENMVYVACNMRLHNKVDYHTWAQGGILKGYWPLPPLKLRPDPPLKRALRAHDSYHLYSSPNRPKKFLALAENVTI